MTRWSRRPGMASPAVASRRRSRYFFRARAFLPEIASEEWRVSCARSVRVVVSRGFVPRRHEIRVFVARGMWDFSTEMIFPERHFLG